MSDIVEAARYILLVIVGLLPIMNPLVTIPIYLSLTGGMPESLKRRQAKKACIYAFCILAAFLLLGNGIIAIFGISMPGIRIAGGIIIMILALKMIFSGEDEASSVDADPADIRRANIDYSFSPLAMPSLSGPGSIAVVMGFGSQIPEGQQIAGYAVVLVGIAITTGIAYIALASARLIGKAFGEHGIQAITKIMGFLLTCVAVQFLASGIKEFHLEFAKL